MCESILKKNHKNPKHIFEKLNLAKNGDLNIAGALLFCRKNISRLPTFVVKCVAYPGNDIHEGFYLDSPPDMSGTLRYVYENAFSVILTNVRNPILASFATKVLPYRGLGNGIRRALKAYPDIEFVNDFDGNLFTVVFKRRFG